MPVTLVTDQLETSPVDDRSYRVVRLANQLEALLVHDAETAKASAAMDVEVGNFSDPADLIGLAHALEHMLFMGTKKYPLENAYRSYLSSHSGSCNAVTHGTDTNYHFEVAAEPTEGSTEGSPFYGALDRFAQFFTEPLFLASTFERELQAVDSENNKYLQDDGWRLDQVDKWLSNPKHPYCKPPTGSLSSLKILPEQKGIDVRKELMKFYDSHYSANRMKLVVLGRESLETLEEWVTELFSNIKNKDLPQLRWDADQPFGDKELLTQYFVKPLMEFNVLRLFFPFLEGEQLYDTQPGRYLSHMICLEGPGSFMSYIKSKGWGYNIGIYGDLRMCPGTPDIFACQIQLTKDGLKQYKEVVKAFFQYLSLLHQTTPQHWIFQEQKSIAEINFKFMQKKSAIDFAEQVSGIMQDPLPRERLLSSQYLLRKFDPALIRKALSFLRPDNFRIGLISQEFPGDWNEAEPWYGTECKYEKIPKDFLVEIEQAASIHAEDRLPELHLPGKNQFIPTNLEVVKEDVKEPAASPKLIRNDELVCTWFKKDDTFWVPMVYLFIKCRNSLSCATVENVLKARIYEWLVTDALSEYAFDAALAGLSFEVTSELTGIEIYLSGYNDKVSILLEKILTVMRDLVIKKEKFLMMIDKHLSWTRDFDHSLPYDQLSTFVELLTKDKKFTNEEYLEVLPRLGFEDIQLFYPQLLRQMHIEILVHGNLYKEDALLISSLIESAMRPSPLLQAEWPINRVLILPPSSNYVYRRTLKDPMKVNHCVEYILQIGKRTDRILWAKALLWNQISQEPFFDQLRTKEQLGYTVESYTTTNSTSTIYFNLIIQGEKTPEYLETRIETFLEDYEQTLYNMQETEFEGHKKSLITELLTKRESLMDESWRLWDHINNLYYDFEQSIHDAANIKPLTKADIIDFYKLYISPSSTVRSKFSIQLIAPGASDNSSTHDLNVALATTNVSKSERRVFESIDDFRVMLSLDTSPKPLRNLKEFEDFE